MPITCEFLLFAAAIPAADEFETHGEPAFAPPKPSGATETVLEALAALLDHSLFGIPLLQCTSLHSSLIQGKETVVPTVAMYSDPFVFCKSSYCHYHSGLLELVGRRDM